MRSPVLIRVDGTRCTGWERMSRALTLALALQRRRRPAYFLSQIDPLNIALNIRRYGQDWVEANSVAGCDLDIKQTLQEIDRLRPSAVIVDSPRVTDRYLEAIRSTDTLVVTFGAELGQNCAQQLLVDARLGLSVDDVADQSVGTQVLLGQRYALIRPELKRARALRGQEPTGSFRVLIALGDDEAAGADGIEVAKQLLATGKVDKIDIALRSFHPLLNELKEQVAWAEGKIDFVTEGSPLTSRVARANLAITSGDTWSLELACVGVPQMMMVRDMSWLRTAQELDEEGAAMFLGKFEEVSALALRQGLGIIQGDEMERKGMSRCGRRLVDGRGADRLVTALEIVLCGEERRRERWSAAA